MKKYSINKKITIIIICVIAFSGLFLFSCKESQKVAAKGGTQLWAENCQRCHNTPSPNTFSDEDWKTVGMHMQTRALLTNTERDKIVEFLQNINH